MGRAAEVITPGGERTWRLSADARVGRIVAWGLAVTLPGLFLWLTLWSNEVAGAGWLALACAGLVWGWLAWRTWTQSATLTQDTLVIRNVFQTERVALADITWVRWSGSRRAVIVTERRAPSSVTVPATMSGRGRANPGERYDVPAIRLGPIAEASGQRCAADEAADLIARAAGLPPLPPRQTAIIRDQVVHAMTTEAGLSAGQRTWRARQDQRGTLMSAAAALPAIAALTLAGWAAIAGHPGAIVPVLAAGVVACVALARRARRSCVTLTRDRLQIRNIVTRQDLALADITDVRFRHGVLAVRGTRRRGAVRAPWNRWSAATAIRVTGKEYWAGLRTHSDDVADEIAAAAGLPPLPARRARISTGMARLMIAAGGLLVAVSFDLVFLHPDLGHDPVRTFGGQFMEAPGIWLLSIGITALRGHREAASFR